MYRVANNNENYSSMCIIITCIVSIIIGIVYAVREFKRKNSNPSSLSVNNNSEINLPSITQPLPITTQPLPMVTQPLPMTTQPRPIENSNLSIPQYAGYTAYEYIDVLGNNIECKATSDISSCAASCTGSQTCKGFNTLLTSDTRIPYSCCMKSKSYRVASQENPPQTEKRDGLSGGVPVHFYDKN